MLSDDLRIYFPLGENQEPEELYEELLFEQKNYFLITPIWTRTIRKKIARIQKIHEAYLAVTTAKVSFKINFDLRKTDSLVLSTIIRTYHQNLSDIKLGINQAESMPELIFFAEQLIENKRNYAHKWPTYSGDFSGVNSPQVIDPVLLLEELKELESTGFEIIKEVTQLEPSNMLYREWIKLSLWLNKEKEIGK